MTGPWDAGEVIRIAAERLKADGWLNSEVYGPVDFADAFGRAMSAALAGRKASGISPPRVAAENFLRDLVINKDTPLAERMHAAALLLQVKP